MPIKRRDDSTWVQTFSGKQFWPLDPRSEDIDIIDIAHALANCNRFAGHTREPYSVAQHSVLCSQIVPHEYALCGLLHDASEAYTGDMPRPIKRAIPAFQEMEDGIMRVVAERFGIKWPMPSAVKRADNILLATERRDLMATPPRPWNIGEDVQPLGNRIVPWTWVFAKEAFLERFKALYRGK